MASSHTLPSRLTVAIALVGLCLLAGVLVSGVARVREAAVRTHCMNNLRQLGYAVHNHASASDDRLPPLVDQGEGAPTGRGLPSVFATLIPYIEATPMTGWSPAERYHAHSSVLFPYRNKDGTPGEVLYGGEANRIWRTFVCPADATANQLRDVPVTLPDGTTGHYATGSYAANGLLPWNTNRFILSASTILFGERPQVCRTATGEVVYNLWGVGFYSPQMPAFAALTPAEPPDLRSTGQVAPVVPLPDEAAPDRDSQLRVRVGEWNATPQGPDFATPLQRIRPGQSCDPRLPGFGHREGMQVAMGDGSGRLFTADTTPWVFWSAWLRHSNRPTRAETGGSTAQTAFADRA